MIRIAREALLGRVPLIVRVGLGVSVASCVERWSVGKRLPYWEHIKADMQKQWTDGERQLDQDDYPEDGRDECLSDVGGVHQWTDVELNWNRCKYTEGPVCVDQGELVGDSALCENEPQR